jgi:probable DNA metabolism protein
MKVMLFDGSMGELLCAVYLVYYGKLPPNLLRRDEYQHNLLDEPVDVLYSDESFTRVRDAMVRKFDRETLDTIAYCLANSSKEAPTATIRYIIACFGNKAKKGDFQDEAIMKAERLSRQASLETHRFTGFVRFSEKGGVYVSKISPDHDILEFLADHFTDRYSDQDFLIYDEKRKKALLYHEGATTIRTGVELDPRYITTDSFTEFWKEYYENIAIRERANPRQQKKSMPVRYWKNLVETGELQENNEKKK